MDFDVVGGVVMTLDEYRAWLESELSHLENMIQEGLATDSDLDHVCGKAEAYENALRKLNEIKPCGN